ncbi:E3 ubiquitin-protein ligase TRIM39 [Drosophila subobscura]|uniref:E3 ubiquitin-protein ligase TRIM39 n=1 Tax=Drosophila subobscura TaxID=7241 RepID=UPI00155A45EA|nr:E3 ubiquitin-protein ligase TRIM39 [Drosophila subobscura]
MPQVADQRGGNGGTGSSGSGDSDGDESTDDHYTCSVCLGTAVRPRVSFCGHLFCAACIEGWLQALGPVVRCPFCRSHIAEKTLITVQAASSRSTPHRRCKSLQEHRQEMLQGAEYVARPAALPQASMFLSARIELPLDALPRCKPLAEPLLRSSQAAAPGAARIRGLQLAAACHDALHSGVSLCAAELHASPQVAASKFLDFFELDVPRFR